MSQTIHQIELPIHIDEYHYCPHFTHEMLREYLWTFNAEKPLHAQLKTLQTNKYTPITCFMSDYWDDNDGMLIINNEWDEMNLDASRSYALVFEINQDQMQSILQASYKTAISQTPVSINVILRLYTIDSEIAQYFGSNMLLPDLFKDITPKLISKIRDECLKPILPIKGFDARKYQSLLNKRVHAIWNNFGKERRSPLFVLQRLMHMELTTEEKIKCQQEEAEDKKNSDAIRAFDSFEQSNKKNIDQYNMAIMQKACDQKVLQLLQGKKIRFEYNEIPSADICNILQTHLPQNHLLTKIFVTCK